MIGLEGALPGFIGGAMSDGRSVIGDVGCFVFGGRGIDNDSLVGEEGIVIVVISGLGDLVFYHLQG